MRSPSPTTAMPRGRRAGLRTCPGRRGPGRSAGASNCACSVVRWRSRRAADADDPWTRCCGGCAPWPPKPERRSMSSMVESLLARVDRKEQPLVAAELLVRRMHLRDIAGQGFIDVDEMREAVRLAEADTRAPVRAGPRGARPRRGVGRSSRCGRTRAAIAIARGTDDLGPVPRARGRFHDGGRAEDARRPRRWRTRWSRRPGSGRLVGVCAR